PLEAVEGKRGERVGRSDLVDDEETPARARDAHELGENELRPRDVMERPERAREIEGAVVERQMLGVALDERHVPVVGGTFPRQLEQLGDPIDADDLAHDRREREGKRARAGTDVDRARERTCARCRRVPRRARPGARRPVRPCARTGQASTTTRRARDGLVLIPHARSWVIVPAARACSSARTPWPMIVTGVPIGTSPASSTANASIDTVPTTRRGSPATRTVVPVRSRRKPSAYPTGTIPIHVSSSATKRRP